MNSMVAVQPLTEMDWRTLEVVAEFEKGALRPTLREVTARMGLHAVSAARRHMMRLEEVGLVTFQRVGPRKFLAARSIRLTDTGVARLERARVLAASGIYVGSCEVRLTDNQYRVLKESEVPVELFPRRPVGRYLVLEFQNWVEREFWAEQIFEVLGIKNEG